MPRNFTAAAFVSAKDTRPLRVCYVIGTLDTGGAERQLITLVNALPSHVEPFVFVLRPQLALRAQLTNPRARVCVVGLRSKLDVAGWAKLARELRRARPDVLHSHMLLSNLATRAFRSASRTRLLINHEHGLSLWKSGPLNLVDRLSHRMADRIIVVSNASRDSRLARERLDPTRLVVVPNAIDWEHWNSMAPVNNTQSQPTWGIAARLVPIKRIHLAIELLHKVHSKNGAKPQLLIAGEGPERQRLENLVGVLDLWHAVTFLGHVEDMASFYKGLDVVLLTSQLEDCPLAIIEGLACGRFIVATRVGGVPELLPADTDSFIIDNESFLSDASNVLSNVPAGFNSQRNRAYARRFDVRDHVRRILEIYSEGLAARAENSVS